MARHIVGEADFLNFSDRLNDSGITYIKQLEGSRGYAVYSATGRELAVFPTREQAQLTAKRNFLETLSVH